MLHRPTVFRSEKSLMAPQVFGMFFFPPHSDTINLAHSVSEKGKGRNLNCRIKMGRRNGASQPAHADWLIAVCHSNIGDTIILLLGSLAVM